MRELQLWTEGERLAGGFEDIDVLARSCRFSDCKHGTEPGCAVRQAIEDGRLDRDRYRSHAKLQREAAWLVARRSQKERLKQKARLKRIAKWSRQRERFGPKAQ
jgi:ribosome biogenesis GTPase